MRLAIIGVPYNLDEHERGMGRAPAALLKARLVEMLRELGHDVAEPALVVIPPSDAGREPRIGQLMGQLGQAVSRARAAGALPIVLGGDCLTALGTLAGLGRGARTGIVWLDAHGDFNTPAISRSGYLGGMPLACAAGQGLDAVRAAAGLAEPIPAHQIVLLGARDLDPAEEQALRESRVTVVTTTQLRAGSLDHSLAAVAGLDQVYLHIDVDVMDPADVPGVDYPTPAGLRAGELATLAARLAARADLAAINLTAVNPEKDQEGRTVAAALRVLRGIAAALP